MQAQTERGNAPYYEKVATNGYAQRETFYSSGMQLDRPRTALPAPPIQPSTISFQPAA